MHYGTIYLSLYTTQTLCSLLNITIICSVTDLESVTGAQSASKHFWVATLTYGHINAFMTQVIIVAAN